MTDELRGKLREWYQRARGYPTWEQAYNEIKPPISLPRFRSYMGEMGGKTRNVTYRETDDGAEIESTSKRIMTLDDLLTACQVDLEQWEVEKCVITKHEMGRKETHKDLEFDEGKITGFLVDSGHLHVALLVNIKVWLKRRAEAPLALAVESIIARLKEHAPQYKVPKPLKLAGDHLLVPAIFDSHFNKRSVDGRYTAEQAKHDFMAAAEALASRALSMGHTIGRVMIPVGNDALHSDDLAGHTTKGTPVELSGAQGVAIAALCEAHQYLGELMAEIAPVDLVIIPGNHDRFSSVWLGQVLAAQFSRHPNVTVLNLECGPRFYYPFGKMLIGLTHGESVKPRDLAQIMATEVPQLWADARYRLWMKGHLHKEQGMLHAVASEPGVRIMTIPSIAPTDEYHLLHGFVGQERAAMGLTYHREYGPATEFPVFIGELAQADAPAIKLAA
jgi:hypothetical protein